ncbi:hypothetical protein H6G04_32145 [Calothrix membranacea FACHB-236]|nr:hypothetical protein [Calothrix membranacea FACHB-236]
MTLVSELSLRSQFCITPYFQDLLLNNPIAGYIMPLQIAEEISSIFGSALYSRYSHQKNQ